MVAVSKMLDRKELFGGPEPAILDWYGHCGVNKLGGESGGMLKILKLGTLRLLLRPCLGQNATRITPPVAKEAIEPSYQK